MSSSALFRFVLLVVPATLAVSCGGDNGGGSGTPASPTPTPPPPSGVASVAGTWSATSDFQQNGLRYVSNATATITQSDRAVQGTVRFTSPGWESWQGTFSGTLAGTMPDSQFVGNVTLQGPSSTGTGICVAQVTMAGPTVNDRMRWEAPMASMLSDVPTQPPYACRGDIYTLVWIFFR